VLWKRNRICESAIFDLLVWAGTALAGTQHREDRIEKVEVDSSRSVMIPDDSIPIVEDGKIVAHRVLPKK